MIEDFVQTKWLKPEKLNKLYKNNEPYPHIVMNNFLNEDILNKVFNEFPNLSKQKKTQIQYFKNQNEDKYSSKGVNLLSPAAFNLIAFLNSEYFLNYLQKLTGIKEILISDPYLSGGGYHEIKTNGVLKIHADFNMHPNLNLHRRLNLLIYLNKNWNESWGGDFQMFDKNMNGPIKRIYPHFNTCVIFSTTSETFHGHPDPLNCPKNKSRKSIALYYFSSERPDDEISDVHSTIFKAREFESYSQPIKKSFIKKIFNKIF